MQQSHFLRRITELEERLVMLMPRVERAEDIIVRLEDAPVPAGAAALARAAQLSASRSMAATLRERRRKLAIAVTALKAEIAEQDGENGAI